MSSDNSVTLTGNLTRDPEMRFSQSGLAIANLGMAVNSRRKVGDGQYEDEPNFFNVTAFGSLAENIGESLTKGVRVTVFGRLRWRQWETDDGQKRSTVEIIAESVAPDLRWATADITKTSSGGGGGSTPADYQLDETPF